MNTILQQELKKILNGRFSQSESTRLNYSRGEDTYDPILSKAVVFPETNEEVSKILKLCNEHKVPVVPFGTGTSLEGNVVGNDKGITISLEKMNKILTVNTQDFDCRVQACVTREQLNDYLREDGVFFPIDPGANAAIGGMASTSASGTMAVKYGTMKTVITGLTVVLPNGDIINTGSRTKKTSAGYNLTNLFIGSEGTLAVVTKIVLKLIPHPTHDALLLVPFFSAEQACEAVAAIFRAGITPSGLEFMERDALVWAQEFTQDFTIKVEDNHEAHLLIEVDGNDAAVIMQECESIVAVLEEFETDEVLFADSTAQKDGLWSLRRKVSEAVKAQSVYKEEDTVVPRYQLPELLRTVKEVGRRYGFQSVCYGHAGDGNLHVNIIRGELSEEFWEKGLSNAIREIFIRVHELGGTISGEHGIGVVQRPYMDVVFPETTLDLMRSIKKVFDPKGILNPGKIF